jgi:hypothetical protein
MRECTGRDGEMDYPKRLRDAGQLITRGLFALAVQTADSTLNASSPAEDVTWP